MTSPRPRYDTDYEDPPDAMIARLRRLGVAHEGLETTVRAFIAADSWCANLAAHASTVKRCPCGYAQVRAALAAIDQAKP